MNVNQNNYAFIDGNNLYLAIRDCGWKLDYGRFRVYLKEKWKVTKAYLFIGYVHSNQKLYQALKLQGYVLIFKPIVASDGDKIKGNVDAEMVLQTMIDYPEYAEAVLVTGDGDFYCLVKYLQEKKKLRRLFIPNRYHYSVLLRRALGESGKITFMNDLRGLLEYKKTPLLSGVLQGGLQ